MSRIIVHNHGTRNLIDEFSLPALIKYAPTHNHNVRLHLSMPMLVDVPRKPRGM